MGVDVTLDRRQQQVPLRAPDRGFAVGCCGVAVRLRPELRKLIGEQAGPTVGFLVRPETGPRRVEPSGF